MLKTPDAAEITQAGRAYLQVGNNEIYELFQSAWSGADYQPDKDDQQIEDHTIYRINELGQYEILSEEEEFGNNCAHLWCMEIIVFGKSEEVF